MLSIGDIKKKREVYERKIEEILSQLDIELSPEVKIENAIAMRHTGAGKLECKIKLTMEDING